MGEAPSPHLRWAPGDLELAREIHKLKTERGLGYVKIGKLLGVHYKRVERLYKKYLKLINSVNLTRPVDGVKSGTPLVSNEPVDKAPTPLTVDQYGFNDSRLGPTQRLIIKVMASRPSEWWTIAAIRSAMGLLRYRYTRQAIFEALRRLLARGIVEYMRETVLVNGDKVRGLYRLRFYAPLDGRDVFVHNLRIAGTVVVSKEEEPPLLLSEALYKAHTLGKTWPVDQVELHMDYRVDPRITSRLRELGWRQTVLYSPKPGYIRLEHRLWDPQGLIATPDQREEWLARHEQFTSLTVEIASRELSRVANNKHR